MSPWTTTVTSLDQASFDVRSIPNVWMKVETNPVLRTLISSLVMESVNCILPLQVKFDFVIYLLALHSHQGIRHDGCILQVHTLYTSPSVSNHLMDKTSWLKSNGESLVKEVHLLSSLTSLINLFKPLCWFICF